MARVAPEREGETVTAPLDRTRTVHVHVRIMDKTFSIPEQWTCGDPPLALPARAVPARVDARRRRPAGRHHVDRVAADRRPGRRGGHGARRTRRPACTPDPGRASAGRARADDPRGGRRGPPRPRPRRTADRHPAHRRLRHRDPPLAAARRRRPGDDPSRGARADRRARTVRGPRAAGPRRRRPRADLRLHPRPRDTRPRRRGDTVVVGLLGAGGSLGERRRGEGRRGLRRRTATPTGS